MQEYDARLEGLQADVLLSLHADSCIEASGYKAAVSEERTTTAGDNRLLQCIDRYYVGATGLPAHPNSVTHDMTQYHAFRRIAPTTPAAILELGFLGGDNALLTRSPHWQPRALRMHCSAFSMTTSFLQRRTRPDRNRLRAGPLIEA